MTPISSNTSPTHEAASHTAPPLVDEASVYPVMATGAGGDETIPRTFLAFADICALALAFVTASVIAPSVHWLLLPTGPLALSLPTWMSLPESPGLYQSPALGSVVWVLVVMSPMTVLFIELLGGYQSLVDQSRSRLLITATLSPLMALGFLTLAFFALKMSSSSRVFVFTFAVVGVFSLVLYRYALRSYKRRRLMAGMYAKNVVLIGSSSAVRWMAQHFRQCVPLNRYQLAGWLALSSTVESDVLDLPILGAAEDLSRLLINSPVHEVIAVQSEGDRDWLRRAIEDCDYFRVKLRIVPEALLDFHDLNIMFRSDQLRLPEVVLDRKHLESDMLFIKRLIDIIISSILLILLAPLFLVIALGIRISMPGVPVFYPWRVIGLKGRPFTGYKFSTMVEDADEQKPHLMARNEMTGPVFKIKNDPRVTPFGRVLRTFSLNELPQLWSVLKGDMSLVGPRPAFRHELARYELWHKRKLSVRPGITCLWQVRGRNRISSFDDWVRMDLEYIDNWSLWLDIKILVRTAFVVVAGSGS